MHPPLLDKILGSKQVCDLPGERTLYTTDIKSPFCVETDHAIYKLDIRNPSKRYRSQFRPFWRLQKILQLVISSAANDPEQEFPAFVREYKTDEYMVFGDLLTERELWDPVSLFYRGKQLLIIFLGPKATCNARDCPEWR